MNLRKLSALACVAGTAFCTGVLAQAPTNPATSPSTGATPSSRTAPGTGMTPSPGVGGATSPGVGSATPSHGGMGTTGFRAVDSDHAGVISRAEASRAGLGGQFTTLDKNNDGRLDSAEFAAHRGDARTPGMQSGASSSTIGSRTTTTR